MDDSCFHEVNRRRMHWERRARKPGKIARSQASGRLQGRQGHTVSIPQVVVRRDHHFMVQAAQLQCSLQIRNPLVAVGGIIRAGPDRRPMHLPAGTVLIHPRERKPMLPIDRERHDASGGVLHHFGLRKCAHINSVNCRRRRRGFASRSLDQWTGRATRRRPNPAFPLAPLI